MSVDLPVGEQVTVPPPNVKRLKVNDAGDPVLISSDGSSTPVGGASWYTIEAAAHAALLPALTESVPVQVGLSNVGEPLVDASDAQFEGGGVRSTGTRWNLLSGATIWQNLQTSVFAVSFQCRLATIAASQYSYIGIVSGATAPTAIIEVGTDNALSTTNFSALGYNGSVTATVDLGTADTNLHTWRIVSDGTTVTFYRDGVAVGTLATNAANFPTGRGRPAFIATAASSGQAVFKCLYSYVGPA